MLKIGAFFEMDTGLRRYDVNTPSVCGWVVFIRLTTSEPGIVVFQVWAIR